MVNVITKSLRDQVLQGFDRRGIPDFVETLLDTSPAAAAALLSRLLPSDPIPEESAGPVVHVEIITTPPGFYFLPADLGTGSVLFSEEEVAEVEAVRARATARAAELRHKLSLDPPDET